MGQGAKGQHLFLHGKEAEKKMMGSSHLLVVSQSIQGLSIFSGPLKLLRRLPWVWRCEAIGKMRLVPKAVCQRRFGLQGAESPVNMTSQGGQGAKIKGTQWEAMVEFESVFGLFNTMLRQAMLIESA